MCTWRRTLPLPEPKEERYCYRIMFVLDEIDGERHVVPLQQCLSVWHEVTNEVLEHSKYREADVLHEFEMRYLNDDVHKLINGKLNVAVRTPEKIYRWVSPYMHPGRQCLVCQAPTSKCSTKWWTRRCQTTVPQGKVTQLFLGTYIRRHI